MVQVFRLWWKMGRKCCMARSSCCVCWVVIRLGLIGLFLLKPHHLRKKTCPSTFEEYADPIPLPGKEPEEGQGLRDCWVGDLAIFLKGGLRGACPSIWEDFDDYQPRPALVQSITGRSVPVHPVFERNPPPECPSFPRNYCTGDK